MAKKKGTDFGEWLDATLSNRGIMGRTLAEKVGVHDSAVSRWRAGRGIPSIEMCAKIADALNVEPLRLTVTAGHVPSEVAGVDPYPPPAPTERRESVKRQLRRIKGLTEDDVGKLMDTYEDIIDEEGK